MYLFYFFIFVSSSLWNYALLSCGVILNISGDKKECKECEGTGGIKCIFCDGEGYLNGNCPDCVGMIERDIKDIIRNGKGEQPKLAKEFWDKRKSENKKGKKKK